LKNPTSRESSQDLPAALCNCSVADLRKEPSIHAGRLSQILLGEQLHCLDSTNEWSLVQMQRDGYVGWTQNSTLLFCSLEYAQEYSRRCSAKVQVEILTTRSTPGFTRGEVTGKLPFGVRLPVICEDGSFVQVQLPDERLWWAPEQGLLRANCWPIPENKGIDFSLDLIRHFIGVPYLWGGRSTFGFDCSGLSSTFWEFMGVVIPRDSYEQFQSGEHIEMDYQPGDLLFFGGSKNEQKGKPAETLEAISHVAISLGGYDVIHANGHAWGVSFNSIKPGTPNYQPWLKDHLKGARRYK
jgi:gamma-D-glutamyl-L-lysine dipeptidyl-peptidase